MTAHPQSRLVELLAELGRLGCAEEALAELTDQELQGLAAKHDAWARPDQMLPPDEEFDLFAFVGARGDGKSSAVAWWIHQQAMADPPKEMLFCAQTIPDTLRVCVGLAIDPKTGKRKGKPSGVMRAAPPWERPRLQGRELVWPNGSRATITSAENTEQRGSEYDIVWLSEIIAWQRNKRLDVWHNIGISARTGDAKIIVDSTPKAGNPIIKEIKDEAEWNQRTLWRGGCVERNAINLAPGYVERMRRRLKGTRREREELDGKEAEDGGGLVRDTWIEQGRRSKPSIWKRRIITCDPTVTNPKPGGHTAGLLSGGVGIDDQIYITRDQSGMMGPDGWAPKLVDEAIATKADVVVIETNRGCNALDYAISLLCQQRGITLNVVQLMAPTRYTPGVINIKLVHSRKDKETRMDPAIMEYRDGKISHCKEADLESLEESLTTWEPETASNRDSPGDLDCVGMLVVEARLLYEQQKGASKGQGALNKAARQQHEQSRHEQQHRPVAHLRTSAGYGHGHRTDTRSRL